MRGPEVVVGMRAMCACKRQGHFLVPFRRGFLHARHAPCLCTVLTSNGSLRTACGPSWRNRRRKGDVEPCGDFRDSSGPPAAYLRGHSSVGRALESHSRGPGFESQWLHILPPPAPRTFGTARGFCIGPCPAANRLRGRAPCRVQKCASTSSRTHRHGPTVTDGASRSRASPPESSRGRARRHSRGW